MGWIKNPCISGHGVFTIVHLKKMFTYPHCTLYCVSLFLFLFSPWFVETISGTQTKEIVIVFDMTTLVTDLKSTIQKVARNLLESVDPNDKVEAHKLKNNITLCKWFIIIYTWNVDPLDISQHYPRLVLFISLLYALITRLNYSSNSL